MTKRIRCQSRLERGCLRSRFERVSNLHGDSDQLTVRGQIKKLLNFTLQLKNQLGLVSLTRKKIIIFPEGNSADFLDLKKIEAKGPDYPFVLHWAGYPFRTIDDLPRADILAFYRDFYYSKLGKANARKANIRRKYLYYEERLLHYSWRLRERLC